MRALFRFALLGLVLILGACAATDPLDEELPDMGDFRLAFNIVVADNMQQVPPSREATGEEWIEALTAEIDRRFGAYEGDRLYHIAVHVDAYALAPPGIPVVLQPRSVLVISANVWDDALQAKLHDEPEQMTIFEGAAPETFLIGSGLARTREEQMQVLARNAARRIQFGCWKTPNGSRSTRRPPNGRRKSLPRRWRKWNSPSTWRRRLPKRKLTLPPKPGPRRNRRRSPTPLDFPRAPE